MGDDEAQVPALRHKWADYETVRPEQREDEGDRAYATRVKKVREKLEWFAGKQDEEGDYIPSPTLTPKQAEWVRDGRPITGWGAPLPPWINLSEEEIQQSRRNKEDLITAKAARVALQEMALGAMTEEVIEGLRGVVPALVKITESKSKKMANMRLRAAKELKEILLALRSVDTDTDAKQRVPSVTVRAMATGKSSAEVVGVEVEVKGE